MKIEEIDKKIVNNEELTEAEKREIKEDMFKEEERENKENEKK